MRDGYDSGTPTEEELRTIQATDRTSTPDDQCSITDNEPTLEELAEIEKQVRFVTKLSTQGQEQNFVSPSIPDAVEGILEIVKEALSTGVVPNNRIRVKLYGTIGTKKAHLLSEVNIDVRPARYEDYR